MYKLRVLRGFNSQFHLSLLHVLPKKKRIFLQRPLITLGHPQ